MRRKPRANSLTFRNKKKDGVKMQMTFDLVPNTAYSSSDEAIWDLSNENVFNLAQNLFIYLD